MNWPTWIVIPVLVFHMVPDWVWIGSALIGAMVLGRWLL